MDMNRSDGELETLCNVGNVSEALENVDLTSK